MSIDVVIRNKQLFKKALQPEDVTLGKYSCGKLDEFGRSDRKSMEGNIVIYDPKKIGRGVSLTWSKDIKNEIALTANFFSTKYDMEMFYEIIRNILHVWKTKNFEQDGVAFGEEDIDRLCTEQKASSLSFMKDVEQLVKGKGGVITIFGAMFPLDIDVKLLEKFGTEKDEEGFADYLHRLQSVDAYYAVPLIYKNKKKPNSFFGNFAITSDTDTIFPTEAKTPLGFKDPATGEALQCEFFVVTLFSYEKKKIVGTMLFEDFMRMADVMSNPEFDKTHVLLKGISEEKMDELANSEHEDPLR